MPMTSKAGPILWIVLHFVLRLPGVAGTLVGFVRDENWYAQYQTNPVGVGYYEFAVNANASASSSLGAAAATDVFGAFSSGSLPAGTYTVASWDVWWRSAYAFNVPVPANGNSPEVNLRLKATMWGYPAFWDSTSYHEFGQTFVATGPITMIYLRDPLNSSFTRTVTVRVGGPAGPSIGVSRSYGSSGDHRLIYGFGEMPTVDGQTYYLRVRSPSPATGAVLMQMDPRPDFSDPMPGGCLHLGNGTTLAAHPERDLGVVIMSDDDGLVTDLFTRSSGNPISTATSIGQSFIARGVHLISAAFWLADPAGPTYVVRLRQNGPGGPAIGTTKRGRPARLFADPEMIVTWAPGECPLVPGQEYFLEVTRDGGGTFNSIYVNRSNPFSYGEAYQDGAAMPGVDLAGTIMEEAGVGSATRPTVQFLLGPSVSEFNRGTQSLRVQWISDVDSDSRVEYAVEHPPYTRSVHVGGLVRSHGITLSNLQPHTLYHYRVISTAPNFRPAISRDFVICTRPASGNLLTNPGFEEGTGASPRAIIPGWNKTGSLDVRSSDGTWFGSVPRRTGNWFLQGALNGGSSDGYVFQRVAGVAPGLEYTFSAWATTWPIENGTWKYDVWNAQGRLIHMRLGIDPTGGTNASAPTVRWTPRMYSHRRYSNLAKTVVAQATNLTVFIRMQGDGVQWHLYGVDDAVLSHEDVPTRLDEPSVGADASFQATLQSRANRTNVIEASGNLVDWFVFTNLFNSAGEMPFADPSPSPAARRFYRARTLP